MKHRMGYSTPQTVQAEPLPAYDSRTILDKLGSADRTKASAFNKSMGAAKVLVAGLAVVLAVEAGNTDPRPIGDPSPVQFEDTPELTGSQSE